MEAFSCIAYCIIYYIGMTLWNDGAQAYFFLYENAYNKNNLSEKQLATSQITDIYISKNLMKQQNLKNKNNNKIKVAVYMYMHMVIVHVRYEYEKRKRVVKY